MSIPILGLISDAIDKIIPDADKRAEAKVKMAELEQKGEFREMEIAMTAIVAEAKSSDPWTSRARPTFLYVMYIYILGAIPAGIIGIWYPEEVKQAIVGVELWLNSMPSELYGLFGVGFLGYVKKRSDDKATLLGKETKKFMGIF